MRTINKLMTLAVIGMAIAVTAISTVARATMQGGGNSLTVRFCENDEWSEDFSQTTDVTVDLVKVAVARMHDVDNGYDYDFAEAGFPDIDFPATPKEDDWERATESVARLVTADTPKLTVTGTGSIPNLDDGVYLILVHDGAHPIAYGSGIQDSLIVDTMGWSYSFSPTLVALPSRTITNGQFDEWQKDVTVTMKPTRNEGIGSIRIEKSIGGYDGREATFAYEIVGRNREGAVAYMETRTMQVKGGAHGERSISLVINDIPTDLSVSVTETYPGAGYKLVSQQAPDDPITTRDAQPVFSFRNEPDGTGRTGGGIVNRFVYDEDGNRDWSWHAERATGE